MGVGDTKGGHKSLREGGQDWVQQGLLQRLVHLQHQFRLLDLCRLADLAHGADHGGEGGEDLHRPGSRSNCEPFCLAKDAVDVWKDHRGYRRHLVAFSSRTSCLRSIQIINLGVCQISRKFFQDSDGSLHSKLVFRLK